LNSIFLKNKTKPFYIKSYLNQKSSTFYPIIGQTENFIKNDNLFLVYKAGNKYSKNLNYSHISTLNLKHSYLVNFYKTPIVKPIGLLKPIKGNRVTVPFTYKSIIYVNSSEVFKLFNFFEKITENITTGSNDTINSFFIRNQTFNKVSKVGYNQLHISAIKNLFSKLTLGSKANTLKYNFFLTKSNYKYSPYILNQPKVPYNINLTTFFKKNKTLNSALGKSFPKTLYKYKNVSFKSALLKLFNKNLPHTKKICNIKLNSTRVLNKNLTLINHGLFVLSHLNLYKRTKSYNFNSLFKLKKILYTFPKPNQVKQLILKRKSSITYFNLLDSNSNIVPNSSQNL
jgi:hypothetical protein